MKLGPDDSGHIGELPEQTRYIARVIGHSVILAKCYELLGDEERARATAAHALTATLDLLSTSQLRQAGNGIERLVRAMYLADLANRRAILTRLADDFRTSAGAAGCDIESARVYAGLILAAKVTPIEGIPIAQSHDVTSDLVSALGASRSAEKLLSALRSVRDQIHRGERDGALRPWSDVWHYIISVRLAELTHSELK